LGEENKISKYINNMLRDKKIKLNPSDYIKLFNIKECILQMHHLEIGLRRQLHKLGFPDIELIYIDGQHYIKKDDLANYRFNNGKIRQIIKKLRVELKKYQRYFLALKKKDFSKSSLNKLTENFQQFIRAVERPFILIDIPVYCEAYFESKVLDKLKNAGMSPEEFNILSTPLYTSYFKRRYLDLIKVRRGLMTRVQFKSKWQWSNMALFYYLSFDDDFIQKQLKDITDPVKELGEIKMKSNHERKNFYATFKKLTPSLQDDAKLMQELIAIRDYRIEVFLRGCFSALNLLKILSQKMGLTYNQFINLTFKEIICKNIPLNLNMRLKGYAIIGENIYTGKELKKLWHLFNKKADLKVVTGTPASKGIVRGRVRIILKGEDAHKLQKGEVLITEQTTPDYLASIRYAAAIVTNIGGLTCHAAVISREFNIPSVVGTSNATQVFKDGDLVEVNANHGWVRKIKQA